MANPQDPTHTPYTLVQDSPKLGAVIKVFGVGGGGGNIVAHLADDGIDDVDLIVANTDIQDLNRVPDSVKKIQIGERITRGLGAGMDPELGKKSAEENAAEIEDQLRDADMAFIVATMGGGTGTGAAPVVAQMAKQLDILTIGVTTRPFATEQQVRMATAESGIRILRDHVDALITMPNDKLQAIYGGEILFLDAFKKANEFLAESVRGIANVVNTTGEMNLDFADLKRVLTSTGRGATVIGTGISTGEERAHDATMEAIKCPLLEDIDLENARNALLNIQTANLRLDEYHKITGIFKEIMGESPTVLAGYVVDETMTEELRVTAIVTGMEHVSTLASPQRTEEPNETNRRAEGRPGPRRVVRITTPPKEETSEPPETRKQAVAGGGSSRPMSKFDIPSLFRTQND